jgi:hypothetical protein
MTHNLYVHQKHAIIRKKKVVGHAYFMEEQLYDRALKGLMEDHAEEMLPELLPESQLISIENVEMNRSNIRADLVYRIIYRGEVRMRNVYTRVL